MSGRPCGLAAHGQPPAERYQYQLDEQLDEDQLENDQLWELEEPEKVLVEEKFMMKMLYPRGGRASRITCNLLD